MSVLLNQLKEIAPAIKEVISLTVCHRRAEETYDRNNASSGGGPLDFDFEKYENDSDVRKTKEDLLKFLNSLTHDQIRIVQAVMYIGRDETDPEEIENQRYNENFYEIYEEAERNGVFDSPQKKVFDYLKSLNLNPETQTIIITTMLEKAPLADYLERGLRILKLNRY